LCCATWNILISIFTFVTEIGTDQLHIWYWLLGSITNKKNFFKNCLNICLSAFHIVTLGCSLTTIPSVCIQWSTLWFFTIIWQISAYYTDIQQSILRNEIKNQTQISAYYTDIQQSIFHLLTGNRCSLTTLPRSKYHNWPCNCANWECPLNLKIMGVETKIHEKLFELWFW